MATNKNTLWIAAEARGILVDPSDASLYLRRHHPEVPTGFFDGHKIQRYIVRSGIDEHLSRVAVLLCCSQLPVATVDKDEDRRIGAAGPVNVELFDFGRSVGRALRGADTGARCIAVAVKALAHLSDEGFVIHLVVRCVEFELVVIHEHQRALMMLRWSHLTSIGESRGGYHRGGRSEHRSAADLLHSTLPNAEQFRGGR